MKHVDVARIVLETLPDALCVASLGTAVSALRAASEDAPHYYFGAAMGSALMAAFGVAEAQPTRDVVALLGDGDFLMGASGLWSVAGYRPPNLTVVVLANGTYAITGGQSIPQPLKVAEVASALGVVGARASTEESLSSALAALERPCVIEAEISEYAWPGPSPFVDPARVRVAFEDRLAGVPVRSIQGLTSGGPVGSAQSAAAQR